MLIDVYDFDGTIYYGDSTVDLVKFCIRRHPSLLAGHIDALVDALGRPVAQTRGEVLDALSIMTGDYADQVSVAFDGAEASLFDDDSATVRLAAFLFLCRLGATSPAPSFSKVRVPWGRSSRMVVTPPSGSHSPKSVTTSPFRT